MADQKDPQADESPTQPSSADGSVVITLRKPIIANGDEVKELKFREPTAADIERCGNPVLLDMLSSETPKMSFDTKSMTAMMAQLAAVPPSTIRQMHPRDWTTTAWSLAGFFMPDL